MDPQAPPLAAGRCTCDCHYSSSPLHRSVKRKLDLSASAPNSDVARVESETEVAALREALAGHQQSIRFLSDDLEEERDAASTAATETMSVMLRLQREKAEALMESRQFKRLAEERMAHDQREIEALEELLFIREQALQSLTIELEAYKDHLLSFGIDPPKTLESGFGYPPLRCGDHDHYHDPDPFGGESDVKSLDDRICQLEMLQTTSPRVVEKGAVDQPTTHVPEQKDDLDGFPDDDDEDDEVIDRVYMIDAVHRVSMDDDLMREVEGDSKDVDIAKLYARLQALEADRESMRQAIVAMRTEKAQLVLLREIAQHLCKEVKPEKRVVRKPPATAMSFSIVSVLKWIMSFFWWRRKASRSKYTFGMSINNAGLLMLLDKSPRLGQWRCFTRPRA